MQRSRNWGNNCGFFTRGDWVVLPAALLNILGNYIGAGLALHKGAKVIRPMFFAVLLMLLVRLAVTLFLSGNTAQMRLRTTADPYGIVL